MLLAAAAPPRHSCPGCDREADAGWQICPYCSTEISRPCPRCEAVAEVSWAICPFCAFDLRPMEDEVAAAVPEATHVPSRRRLPVRPARPMPLGGAMLRPRHELR
jgi:RNA polymerase subunit RPABC4/transcription elongation factor Spt4